MPFPFEDLIVYKNSLVWIQFAHTLVSGRRARSFASLRDQLSRASLSIALNIAEGNGRWHAAEKRNFFWIARGSVFECVPILQVLRDGNVVTETEYREAYAQLEALGKMLTNLVKSVEKPTIAQN